jgi:hypothetical protein
VGHYYPFKVKLIDSQGSGDETSFSFATGVAKPRPRGNRGLVTANIQFSAPDPTMMVFLARQD